MIGDHFSKHEPPNKAEVAYSESAGQHSSCQSCRLGCVESHWFCCYYYYYGHLGFYTFAIYTSKVARLFLISCSPKFDLQPLLFLFIMLAVQKSKISLSSSLSQAIPFQLPCKSILTIPVENWQKRRGGKSQRLRVRAKAQNVEGRRPRWGRQHLRNGSL